MPEDKKEKSMEFSVMYDAADDKDFLRCLEYVKLREVRKGMKRQEVADYFEIHINSLDLWISKWTKSGLINRCRRIIAIPSAEEVRVVEGELMQEWPKIIRRQKDTAMYGKSDKNALEAATWLYENFVKPAMEQQVDAGVDELDYISSVETATTPFNPLSLNEPSD